MYKKALAVMTAILMLFITWVPSLTYADTVPGHPYVSSRAPDDDQKKLMHGRLTANIQLDGIDDKPFDMENIFKDGITIKYIQTFADNGEKTGVEFSKKIYKAGNYTLSYDSGKEMRVPLYSDDGRAYKYLFDADYDYNDRYLFEQFLGTNDYGFYWDKPDENGKMLCNISEKFHFSQNVSTRFKVTWNTQIPKNDRPKISGIFYPFEKIDPLNTLTQDELKDYRFDFVKDENDETILGEPTKNYPGDLAFIYSDLMTKPIVKIDETNTGDLKFLPNKKIVQSGDKKFKYEFTYDIIKGGHLTITEIIPVTFNPDGGQFDDKNITSDKDKPYVVWVEYGKSVWDKVPKNVKKDKQQFLGWKWPQFSGIPSPRGDFENITRSLTFYPLFTDDVREYDPNNEPGVGSYDNFVKVHVDLTDKAKIENGEKQNRHFRVDPTHSVFLPVQEPNGKLDKDENGRSFTWKFTGWKSKETPARTWTIDDENSLIHGQFYDETWIEAQYEKEYVNNDISIKTLTKSESIKDGSGKLTNDFLPDFKTLTKQIKIVNDQGKEEELPEKVKVEYVAGTNQEGNPYKDFDEEIYDKLREKENPKDEPSRNELIKAKITFADGEIRDIEIPIKVIKNIYEAKTLTEKPHYVPDNYVQVTLNPTKKASDPQKTYFYVNPSAKVLIPGENPTGTGIYTFSKWIIKDKNEDYSLSDRHQFEEKTTIEALYTTPDVIPYDPKAPMTKPEGYHRVKFAKEAGLKLENIKYYYVKDGKSITLVDGEGDYPYPTVKAETGFEFKKWDKGPKIDNIKEDLTVTAKVKKLDDVIEKTPSSTTPEGYKTVTFVAGENGKLKDDKAHAYYVNPNKYVKITPPGTEADDGFEFSTWSQDSKIPTQYSENTKITATFNEIKSVIPKKSDDTKKPKGYVTVEFKTDGNGDIEKDEIATYYVNPKKDVTLNPPKTKAKIGYEFDKWDKDTTSPGKYSNDTVITGSFKKIDDIIPSKDEEGNDNIKPNGYVEVKFDANKDGKLDGKTLFYVNPKAGKTIADITNPEVTPNIGFEFDKWDQPDTIEIKENITLKAIYKDIAPVIPQFDNDGNENEKPAGYIKVTFNTTANGKIKDTDGTKEKVLYINPNKAVSLEEYAPDVTANEGYIFKDWDTSIKKEIKYKNGDEIKALYNNDQEKPDENSPEFLDDGIISKATDTYKDQKIDESVYKNLLRSSYKDNPIQEYKVTQEPDVSVLGYTQTKLEVTLKDGTIKKPKVLVYVKEKCENQCPNPNGNDPQSPGNNPQDPNNPNINPQNPGNQTNNTQTQNAVNSNDGKNKIVNRIFNPQTGDNSNVYLYFGVMLMSLILISFIVKKRKFKQKG